MSYISSNLDLSYKMTIEEDISSTLYNTTRSKQHEWDEEIFQVWSTKESTIQA